MDAPFQPRAVSAPLSPALLWSGVRDNNCWTDTKGNSDGHQILQDCSRDANTSSWVPEQGKKKKKKAKFWTESGHSTPSTTQGITSFWGPREGVEDEITNSKGPDEHITTLYSTMIRAEATAQRNSLKKPP